jgi:hypothetical protein
MCHHISLLKKNRGEARYMLVMIATQKAEIRRITVQDQPKPEKKQDSPSPDTQIAGSGGKLLLSQLSGKLR